LSVLERHPNGSKKLEGTLKDGKTEGPAIYWSESGAKVSECFFRADEAEGTGVFWYESGAKLAERQYRKGKQQRLDARAPWTRRGERFREESGEREEDLLAAPKTRQPVVDERGARGSRHRTRWTRLIAQALPDIRRASFERSPPS